MRFWVVNDTCTVEIYVLNHVHICCINLVSAVAMRSLMFILLFVTSVCGWNAQDYRRKQIERKQRELEENRRKLMKQQDKEDMHNHIPTQSQNNKVVVAPVVVGPQVANKHMTWEEKEDQREADMKRWTAYVLRSDNKCDMLHLEMLLADTSQSRANIDRILYDNCW